MRPALLTVALLLLALPLGSSHDMLLPDPTCSGLARVHHYVAPGGKAEWHDRGLEASGQGTVLDGNEEDCDLDGDDHDHDGELEFGIGAGVLAVWEGAPLSGGSLTCLDIMPHHGIQEWVGATDAVSGPVVFAVATDTSLVPPLTGPDCGDGIIEPNSNPGDHVLHCIEWCYVPMPPGSDGAYWIFLETTDRGTPTWGHIESASASGEGDVPYPADGVKRTHARSYEHVATW